MDKARTKLSYYQLTVVLVFCVSVLFLPGCGIMRIDEEYGQSYNIDNTVKVKPGMTADGVTKLLGKPYVIGNNLEGDMVYEYNWRQSQGNAFVFGLFVMGEKRNVTVSGGEATITFSSDTKSVKKVEYSIIGRSNYEKLRGGNSGAAH